MFNLLKAGAALGKGNKVVHDDPREAVRHYLKGLAVAPSNSSARFFLRLGLVEAYRATGDLDDAIGVLRQIEDTAREDETHPSPRRRSYRMGTQGVTALEARLGAIEELADVYGEARQPDAKVAALQRLADVAGECDLTVRAEALREVAEVERRRGRSQEAKASIQLALDEAVARNDVLGRAEALHIESLILWDNGDRVAAQDRLRIALELFKRAADLRGQSEMVGQLGLFAWRDDDLITARDYFAESLKLARAAGSQTLADKARGWLDRIGERLANDGTDAS